MSKYVFYFTQDSQKVQLDSDAQTWGELRKDFDKAVKGSSKFSQRSLLDKKIIEKSTRKSLDTDSSELNGCEDAINILYIYPQKSKFGSNYATKEHYGNYNTQYTTKLF